MTHFLFVKGNKFVRAVDKRLFNVGDDLCIAIYTKDGSRGVINYNEVIWMDKDKELVRSMVRGTIQIKNRLTWWLAYIVVLNNLDEYVSRYPYLKETADKLFELESSLSHPDERTDVQAQKAVSLVNKLWNDLPDTQSIHSLPRFGLLCDLCSESWVFEG